MRNKVLVKFSSCFSFLVVSLLILFGSIIGKAQTNSAVNLSSSEWSNIPIPIRDSYNSSVTTDTYKYNFDEQGNVTIKHVRIWTEGSEYRNVYNPVRNEWEYTRVPTMPSGGGEDKRIAKYKIKGNRIYIDHPLYVIDAEIRPLAMEGTLTYKGSGGKEHWLIAPNKSKSAGSSNSSNKTTNESNNAGVSNSRVGTTTLGSLPVGGGDFGSAMDPKEALAQALKVKAKAEEAEARKKAEEEAAATTAARRKAEFDALLVGNWKHLELVPNSDWLKKEVIINFSKGSSAASSIRTFSTAKSMNWNWKYTAENDSSGIMDLFIGDTLIEKATVRWLSKNQFEYTITYVNLNITWTWEVSNLSGEKFVFTRQ